MKTPQYWQKACHYLSEVDPVMDGLITRYEGEFLSSRSDAFQTLLRAIIGQQISVKAADALWRKLDALVEMMQPETMLDLSEEQLRSCGLSRQKIAYVGSLSEHFLQEHITADYWPGLSDEEVIADLTQVKGIGVWTAEMFLIFHLLRPDVFPVADLGVLKAIDLHYPSKRKRQKKDYQQLAEAWKPYRTVASWYLWRALDPVPVSY